MNTLRHLMRVLLLLLLVYSCKTTNDFVSEPTETLVVNKPRTVQVRGETFHYIERGQGEALIFIHGGLGDYRAWLSRMEPYSEKYHVIAYSRRYAWPSKDPFDENADYSVRPHAKDLHALVENLGLKKVHLIGHSYGAFTALAFALDHPEMVHTLVLGEPPVVSLLENVEGGTESHQAFIKTSLEPAAEMFRAKKNEEGITKFIEGVDGEALNWADVPLEAKQGWLDNVPEIYGYTILDEFVNIELTKLKSLHIPTLLFIGDRSPQILVDISKELNRLLPDCQLSVLANSSHGLMYHNPVEFDKQVMQFLALQKARDLK